MAFQSALASGLNGFFGASTTASSPNPKASKGSEGKRASSPSGERATKSWVLHGLPGFGDAIEGRIVQAEEKAETDLAALHVLHKKDVGALRAEFETAKFAQQKQLQEALDEVKADIQQIRASPPGVDGASEKLERLRAEMEALRASASTPPAEQVVRLGGLGWDLGGNHLE